MDRPNRAIAGGSLVGDLLHFRISAGDTAATRGITLEAEEGPARQRTGPMSRRTLSTLIDAYSRDRIQTGEVSRRSAHDQRTTLIELADVFGRRPVANMAESDIIRWMGTMAALRPSTRRKKLSIVKGFTRWLVRQGHVRKDPCINIRPPRQPRTVPKVFDSHAVGALLDACPDARARLIVLLMVQEGLRAGEVAGLELGDIDGRMVLVEGKGGHQRVVPLVAEVRSALDAYLVERGGYAGPLIQHQYHAGRGLTSHTISDLIGRLCRSAGIKRAPHDGISAHGLRRTCASDLAERDIALLDIAEALGHQSVETTRKYYTRHRASRLASALEGRVYGSQRAIGRAG